MKKNLWLVFVLIVFVLIGVGCNKNVKEQTIKPSGDIIEEKKSNNEELDVTNISGEEINYNTKERYNAFYKVINDYNENSKWPDGQTVYRLGTSYDEDQDAFAIIDIDGDNKDELIIRHSDATMAEMLLMIYDYNNSKDEIIEEYMGSPFSTFYKNGFIRRDVSHNQGKAFEFMWPHALEKYDEQKDTYVEFAYVDGWDKSFDEIFPDYIREGEKFPVEVDKDGNGGVYQLFEASGEEGKYLDDSEFEDWMNKNVGTLEEMTIPYLLFTNENIVSIKNK